MKNTVVVFGNAGARIVKTENLSEYENRRDVLINPEVPFGVPPHRWSKEGHKIVVVKDQKEIARRVEILQGKTPSTVEKCSREFLLNVLCSSVVTNFILFAALLYSVFA